MVYNRSFCVSCKVVNSEINLAYLSMCPCNSSISFDFNSSLSVRILFCSFIVSYVYSNASDNF